MKGYFTKFEKVLWVFSVSVILISFLLFDKENYLTLIASLIGVTSLIFCAKGNPTGQILMIIFSSIYGYISLSYDYYGELITYVGMTLPMSAIALVAWLKNPFKGRKSEVEVDKINKKDAVIMWVLTVIVTVILYFVLKYFGTANLLISTVSVTTSFLAVYLSYKRSPYFALAYAFNDVVLIILWGLAAMDDISYLSVIICFTVFLINDLYSFSNWIKMQKRQSESYK